MLRPTIAEKPRLVAIRANAKIGNVAYARACQPFPYITRKVEMRFARAFVDGEIGGGIRVLSEDALHEVVAHLVGADTALSSEREYTRRTLPRGVWREARTIPTDRTGLLRAGAILAGLTVTATGYLSGRARRATDAGAEPVRSAAVPNPSAAR